MNNKQIENKLYTEVNQNMTVKILFVALIEQLEIQGYTDEEAHQTVCEIYAEQIGETYDK